MQPAQHEGSRNVLHLNRDRQTNVRYDTNSQPRREIDPRNGHEAILRTMIKKKAKAVLYLTDGTSIAGRISQFDHFTITIYSEDNNDMPETFFKHVIRSFTTEPDQGE